MDFEERIRHLLHTGQTEDITQGARRSECRKKPSSCWNKEAGFIPQPPILAKKKGISTLPLDCTSSDLLLISDWVDIQLINYCNACGILFDSLAHA